MADGATTIKKVPGAWKCKLQVFVIAWYSRSTDIPSIAYSPLEAASPFASAESGRPVGGLYNIQIIRYSDTPVGPYDELLIAPGAFAYDVGGGGGDDDERRTESHLRITRIYVSTRETCYNGRRSESPLPRGGAGAFSLGLARSECLPV